MKIHRATLRVIQPEMMEILRQWIAINFDLIYHRGKLPLSLAILNQNWVSKATCYL